MGDEKGEGVGRGRVGGEIEGAERDGGDGERWGGRRVMEGAESGINIRDRYRE